jgi:hypothetical protein
MRSLQTRLQELELWKGEKSVDAASLGETMVSVNSNGGVKRKKLKEELRT